MSMRWSMGSVLTEASLERVIASGGVTAHYQPIVELATCRTVGFEALARGPQGSPYEMPGQLFPAAEAAGLRVELERACLSAAFKGASQAGLAGGGALFVNLEPGLLQQGDVDRLLHLKERVGAEIPIYVELTERELVRNPMQLLRSVDRMRSAGLRIALDDVGADSASLALLPFLDPEVIKLDLSLVHAHPRGEVAEIVHAVNAESERTGAIVLAEGIEHEQHLDRARAIGATLGQGWYFGRPGPLDRQVVEGSAALRPPQRDCRVFEPTPFEVVSAERTTRTGDKRLLLALSMELEAHAVGNGCSTVLLATFQKSDFFTPRVASRYTPLASSLPLVGALAHGPNPERSPGVRWADLPQGDPLIGEWDVSVIAPHFAAAFVARDLGDTGSDMDRRFEFAITYERGLAVRAARSMMRRLAGGGSVTVPNRSTHE